MEGMGEEEEEVEEEEEEKTAAEAAAALGSYHGLYKNQFEMDR